MILLEAVPAHLKAFGPACRDAHGAGKSSFVTAPYRASTPRHLPGPRVRGGKLRLPCMRKFLKSLQELRLLGQSLYDRVNMILLCMDSEKVKAVC